MKKKPRGDRLTAANTFREFVVYDADQIYPDTFLERTKIPLVFWGGYFRRFFPKVVVFFERTKKSSGWLFGVE